MKKCKDVSLLYKLCETRIDSALSELEKIEYNCSIILTEEIHESIKEILPKLYHVKQLINEDSKYFHEIVQNEVITYDCLETLNEDSLKKHNE